MHETSQNLSDYGKGTFAIDAADVDGDGDLDFIAGMGFSAVNNQYYNTVWNNFGSGYFYSSQSVGFSEDQTYAINAVDVDNDGDLDILVGNRLGYDRIYINNGSGVFNDSGQTIGNSDDDTWDIMPADLNHDGYVDFITCHYQQGSALTVLFNNGNGTFMENQQLTYPDDGCRDGALIDIEGDGDLDIIEGRDYKSRVYLNDGSGNFTFSNELNDIDNTTDQVLAGDLDGDGDQDYIINKVLNGTLVWLNDGSGNFTGNGQTIEYLKPLASSLCDMDGDGDLDIVGVDGSSNGGMRIWLNDGNAQFSDSGFNETHTNHFPTTESVHCADLDSDGDLELIEGNTNSVSYLDPDRIWLNFTNPPNNAPTPPALVSETDVGTTSLAAVVLEWLAGSDAETTNPNLLTYDVRVGATSGGCEIYCGFFPSVGTSPWRAGGFGSNGYSRAFRIDLPEGTYYWSVRTVDTTFKRSAWSAEDSFHVFTDEAIPPVITDNQNGDDTARSQNNGTYDIDFTDTGNSHLSYFQVRACSTASNCGDIVDWTDVATDIGTDSYTGNWALPATVWDSLIQGQNYISVSVFDRSSNSDEDGPLFYVIKDTVLPVQSGWLPATGTVINHSTETITLNTDEPASCKVSLEDKDYSQMTITCAGGGTTSHSCAIINLVDGTEVVYTACLDIAGNADTSITNEHLTYVVDTTPPGQSNWSPAKGSRFSTSMVSISFDTNEIASCKWSLSDLAYGAMTEACTGDNDTIHSCPADGLPEGAATVYIACTDSHDNADSISTNEHVDYTVDRTPPLKSNWSPASGADVPPAFSLVFETDEDADCVWDFNDLDYTGMNGTCDGSQGKMHSCSLSGLPAGALSVYAACEDNLNNHDSAASNTHLSFSVDVSNPADISYVYDGTGADTGFSSSTTQLSANWAGSSDPESGISAYWYSIGSTPGASDTLAWTSNGAATGITKTGLVLSPGQVYYVSIKARNGAGLFSNITTSNGQKIDTSPPVTADNWTDVYTSSSPVNITLIPNDGAGSGVNATKYCVDTSNTCTPSTSGTTAAVSCSEGIVCTQYVRYYSIDNVGNSESFKSKRVRTDHTPPSSVPYVYDGSGADAAFFASATAMSANWAAASDAQSGIARYWIGIGTTAGATDTHDWTDAGNALAITVSDLTLVDGYTYYVTVKAENGVGRMSTPTNSNGQALDTSMTEPVPAVYDGTGSDIEFATSSTQLSANWLPAPAPNAGIARYLYAIGTVPGGTQVVDWTDNGQAVQVTRTGLSLTLGQTYYVSVMAESGIGIRSEPASSNGQTVDITTPTLIGTVKDGTGADIEYTSSAAQLSANWPEFSDPESGINRCWYAIGTTAGASDTLAWTENGTNTTVTRTGLTLSEGQKYFFSVKAENRAGLMSYFAISNGQIVDTVSPAEVAALTATPGTLSMGLSWVNPVDSGLNGIKIIRNTAGFPASPDDGTQVCFETTESTCVDDNGLSVGTQYYYAAFAFDRAGNYSSTQGAGAKAAMTISPGLIINKGWNQITASKQNISINTSEIFGDSAYEIISCDSAADTPCEYMEKSGTLNLNLAAGYWIFSEEDAGIIAAEGGHSYTDVTFERNLTPGWNMIASPYSDGIRWDNEHAMIICDGSNPLLPPLYHYVNASGAYTTMEPNSGFTLIPWDAYWLRIDNLCTLVLVK